MTRPEVELRHGYTLDRIAILAKASAKRAFTSSSLTPADRLDTAWHGVINHLYQAATPPTQLDLIRAGTTAIRHAENAERQTHGIDMRDYSRTGPIPGFMRYWTPIAGPRPDDIIDQIAVMEIMPTLTYTQQEALFALAAFDSYQAAADALGIGYDTLLNRVRAARRAFYRLWHEHETPSKPWGHDRRVGHEHQAATRAIRRRRLVS